MKKPRQDRRRKTEDPRLTLSLGRKGWIVWTWSKLGSLMVFMGIMLMLMTAYGFSASSSQAQAANQLSQTLKFLILDTYDSLGDMSFEYMLPERLAGEDYSVEVLDKEADTAGIVTKTKSGVFEVSGGASLSVPLYNSSFGLLRDYGEGGKTVCIVKHDGVIYLEHSPCS